MDKKGLQNQAPKQPSISFPHCAVQVRSTDALDSMQPGRLFPETGKREADARSVDIVERNLESVDKNKKKEKQPKQPWLRLSTVPPL